MHINEERLGQIGQNASRLCRCRRLDLGLDDDDLLPLADLSFVVVLRVLLVVWVVFESDLEQFVGGELAAAGEEQAVDQLLDGSHGAVGRRNEDFGR